MRSFNYDPGTITNSVIGMGKTAAQYILETEPEIEINHGIALAEAGWYNGFEYRILSDDLEFNGIETEKWCDKCKEFHRSKIEGKWIRPDRPLKIGKNWAKAHHIQSIIESRSIIFEKKIGKKSFSPQTWVDINSFESLGDWMPYLNISKTGKVAIVGETHTPIKIKNPYESPKVGLRQ